MTSTHFGFQSVDEADKARHVRSVFDSVAPKYDLMNDLMSGGLHRVWKAYTLAVANLQPGDKALDIAGGTGDLALAFRLSYLNRCDPNDHPIIAEFYQRCFGVELSHA